MRFVLPATLAFTTIVLAAGCSSGSSGGATPGGGGDDGGTTGSGDGGGSTDESAWLAPMNAARAAVGEKPFTWDPIAAQVAAGYAATCDFAHNPNRNTAYQMAGGGSGGLGENIAAGAPTQAPADAVSSWLSEEGFYDHASNTCQAGETCGHYTQIVWSTTTAVGCAHQSCTMNSPFGGFSMWDIDVCDFSPPGNVTGQAPY
jgi:hypothetical protein